LNLPAGSWEKVGTFKDGHSLPALIVPLKMEGRLLGVSSSQGFQEPGAERGSYVGVFCKRDGKLILEACLELPFDDLPSIVKGQWINRTHVGTGGEAAGREAQEKPGRVWTGYADPPLLMPNLVLPSLSEDFLVLGAASSGVLWILDLENGKLCRTISLYGLSRKDLPKIAPLKHVILGTGFTPDGDLIVASKHPDLIRLAIGLDMDKPDSPDQESKRNQLESFMSEIKDICWWRIDPKNGTQERIYSPVEFPEQMPIAARQTVFRFLVDPFGHVKSNAFMSWSKVMEAFLATSPDRQEGPLRSPSPD